MSKGEQTRQAILSQALELSSEVGLEGLSFGNLAKRSGLSKSGLYAHFESKESLMCAVLDTAAERFVDVVLGPALKEARGVPRIRRMFELWLTWIDVELTGGCPFVAAAAELDDRPGPVRDRLVAHFRDILGMIERAASIAVQEGHFASDYDPEQFAFEVWGTLLAYHQYRRLLQRSDAAERAHRALDTIIDRASAPH